MSSIPSSIPPIKSDFKEGKTEEQTVVRQRGRSITTIIPGTDLSSVVPESMLPLLNTLFKDLDEGEVLKAQAEIQTLLQRQLSNAGVSSLATLREKALLIESHKPNATRTYLSTNLAEKINADKALIQAWNGGVLDAEKSLIVERYWHAIAAQKDCYEKMQKMEQQSLELFVKEIFVSLNSNATAMPTKTVFREILNSKMEQTNKELQEKLRQASDDDRIYIEYLILKGQILMPSIINIALYQAEMQQRVNQEKVYQEFQQKKVLKQSSESSSSTSLTNNSSSSTSTIDNESSSTTSSTSNESTSSNTSISFKENVNFKKFDSILKKFDSTIHTSRDFRLKKLRLNGTKDLIKFCHQDISSYQNEINDINNKINTASSDFERKHLQDDLADSKELFELNYKTAEEQEKEFAEELNKFENDLILASTPPKLNDFDNRVMDWLRIEEPNNNDLDIRIDTRTPENIENQLIEIMHHEDKRQLKIFSKRSYETLEIET